MMTRRRFLATLSAGAALAAAGRVVGAQDAGQTGASNLGPMDQSASRSVRRPPKPGAAPSMTPDERDVVERQLKCQCGCTLDVYTCRTTDFSCQVSPAMHRDVMSLVEGGYGAQEIVDAFVETYGEQILLSPKKEGFNLVGYGAPFAALAGGVAAVTLLVRRWGARAAAAPASGSAAPPPDATREELARVEAAVREDDR